MDNSVTEHHGFLDKISNSRLLARYPLFQPQILGQTLLLKIRNSGYSTPMNQVESELETFSPKAHFIVLHIAMQSDGKMCLLNLCYDDFACNLLFPNLICSLFHRKECIHLTVNMRKNKIIWLGKSEALV